MSFSAEFKKVFDKISSSCTCVFVKSSVKSISAMIKHLKCSLYNSCFEKRFFKIIYGVILAIISICIIYHHHICSNVRYVRRVYLLFELFILFFQINIQYKNQTHFTLCILCPFPTILKNDGKIFFFP